MDHAMGQCIREDWSLPFYVHFSSEGFQIAICLVDPLTELVSELGARTRLGFKGHASLSARALCFQLS